MKLITPGKCTELILISRCYYGSVSPFVRLENRRFVPKVYFALRCTIRILVKRGMEWKNDMEKF